MSKRSKKWIAAVLAASAFLGAVQGLSGGVSDAARALFGPSAAKEDSERIAKLRTGQQISAFESVLGVAQQAVINSDIVVPGSGLVLEDRLYLTPTAYIEAFVDQRQAVQAYTVTARLSAEEWPESFEIYGRQFDFGKSKFDSSGWNQVERVAMICGAHILSYYEISGTDGAHRYETVAMGLTSAGGLPSGQPFPVCSTLDTDSLPAYKGVPNSKDDEIYADQYEVRPEYMSATASVRSNLLVNSVCITAPGVPVISAMLSLHPDVVYRIDPQN